MNPCILLFALCAGAASLDLGLTSDQLLHVQDDPPVSHLVDFEISQGEYSKPLKVLGELKIALFASVVPSTCSRFLHNAQTHYKDSVFHRIVHDFVVQGGGMKMVGDGQLEDIPVERFDDENFLLTHNKLGRLSMANAGPNTNGCQFFITTAPLTSHLDGKHVVFGQLVSGFEVLQAMNTVELQGSSPKTPVYILKVSAADLTSYSTQSVDSVSLGYSFFMFFCVISMLFYALHRYTSRRLFVDLSSFKM